MTLRVIARAHPERVELFVRSCEFGLKDKLDMAAQFKCVCEKSASHTYSPPW